MLLVMASGTIGMFLLQPPEFQKSSMRNEPKRGVPLKAARLHWIREAEMFGPLRHCALSQTRAERPEQVVTDFAKNDAVTDLLHQRIPVPHRHFHGDFETTVRAGVDGFFHGRD